MSILLEFIEYITNCISGNCFQDRCLANGILQKESLLKSNNGKLKLILQGNGNLEILCGNYSIWSSGTYGYNIDALHFNSEGKILILNKDKSVAKELVPLRQSTHSAEKLILQDDGNLVLYDYNSNPLWSTGTNGKCIESKTVILFIAFEFGS